METGVLRGNLDAEGKLHTLNAHVGRQTWEFDANASEEDVQKQDVRGKSFERQSAHKHSKDALIEDAFDAQRKERKRESSAPMDVTIDEKSVTKETKRR